MLATYLPLLFSSQLFVQQIALNSRNIYRLALPLFIGVFLMGAPSVLISDMPVVIRPLFSNGMLVAILLAVILENTIKWDKIK